MKKIIIDTDIGTDVDDLLAIAYALKNPNVDVKLITTTHDKNSIRARITAKAVKTLGSYVEIVAGNYEGPKNWRPFCGFEENVLNKGDIFNNKKETVDSLIDNIRKNKNDISLICIGPLTNIAKTLEKDKEIVNYVNEVYVMGSNPQDHNFEADIGAATKVINQQWPITKITKEVSLKTYLTLDEIKNIRNDELGKLFYDSAVNWLQHVRRNVAYLYDPLTVSACINDFVKFKKEGKDKISVDVNINAFKKDLFDMLKE